MNIRSRFVMMMLAVASITMLAAFNEARAVAWNCPGGTTVINNTGCAFNLRLMVGPVNVIVNVPVPAGPGAVAFVNTANVTSIDFVYSWTGRRFAILTPPPAAPCNCLPGDSYTCCIELAPGCCCDVCFDPVNCTITINPAACFPPGPCQS